MTLGKKLKSEYMVSRAPHCRAPESLKVITICLVIMGTIFLSNPSSAQSSERKLYSKIKYFSRIGDSRSIHKYSSLFLKRYKKSRYIADVRLIQADNEPIPNRAVWRYRVIVKNYRYFKKRPYAQYKICSIYYLMGKNKNLIVESKKGLALFKTGPYRDKFSYMLIHSYTKTDRYWEAKRECKKLLKRNHSPKIMAKTLLLLSHIEKKISGYSKGYIRNLKEMNIGFKHTEEQPSMLFLLGDFYERTKHYSKSYSAYSDLITHYPKSPETRIARKKISRLKKYNPRRVSYLPNNALINKTDSIDIRPEMDIEQETRSRKYYSVSIGPFDSKKKSQSLKYTLKAISSITTVHLRKGYFLYCGKFSTSDRAVQLKIRLAEEYAINGRIVRFSKKGKRIFVYGEG